MKQFFVTATMAAVLVGCAGKYRENRASRGGLGEQMASQTGSEERTAPAVIGRGSGSRIWKTVTSEQREGRTIRRTNSFVELATGLHYFEDGEWKVSRDEITASATGAEATKGPHKVHFEANIRAAGAVTLTTPDNKVLSINPLSLAYSDPVTGQSVVIAEVRDSTGILLPPNQVLYPDAFAGVRADVRFTYTKDKFESDVILRSRLPSPANFGLNPETTLLEVWHEFAGPQPEIKRRTITGLNDDTLNFGAMRAGRGGAFALEDPLARLGTVPVGKTWIRSDNPGRAVLVESVRYKTILPELETLPPAQASITPLPDGQPFKGESRLALLNAIQRPVAISSQPMRAALDLKGFQAGHALVLDYVLYGGTETDFTFQADTTYLISSSVNLFGTATFEGGTVIKLATTNTVGVAIQTWNDVVFKSDQYRPVIFTSQNDRTVGEDFYVSGAPMQYFNALSNTEEGMEYKHLRISYALYGLHAFSMKVRHAQFLHCTYGITTDGEWADVENALFYDCGIAFGGFDFTSSGTHVTVNQCTNLASTAPWGDPASASLALTNSLIVNVLTNGGVNVTTNYTVTTTSNIFQTVGAGGHYLLDPSPYRDAGTTNIPTALLGDLKKRTTYPPLIIAPGGYYGVSQTLFPRAGRDTDLPDLGYHYDPLDYAINFVYLTNATIQVDPGTSIAVFNPSNFTTYGLALATNAQFIASGRADSKVSITHYSTVQEMANTNWNGLVDALVIPWMGMSNSVFRCRFTDFTGLGGSIRLVSAHPASAPWELTDCQFHGGLVFDGAYLSWGGAVFLTNCLFNRCAAELWPDSGRTSQIRNGTIFGGRWISYFPDPQQGVVTDCLFADTDTDYYEYGNPTNSNIAYTLGCTASFESVNTNDVILTNLTFQTGPLGYFYIPSNALWNAGSRNATNAGLYHYTMLTNQVKEANSQVDIGFHYVATDANGTPLDYDGDGVPDYWEDTNGNGSYDPGDGETNWQAYNSANGLSNSPNLKVFTPLK